MGRGRAALERKTVAQTELQSLDTEWGEGAASYTMGSNSRVRAIRARRELGWTPLRPSLVDDIERGSYHEAF